VEAAREGSRSATAEDHRDSVNGMEKGEISIQPWITKCACARKVLEALPGRVSGSAGLIKATIEWGPCRE
jgi:hypothetical protein